jgi:hypothetical protein
LNIRTNPGRFFVSSGVLISTNISPAQAGWGIGFDYIFLPTYHPPRQDRGLDLIIFSYLPTTWCAGLIVVPYIRSNATKRFAKNE